MNEPVLGKAMTVLEFLSQDNEARKLYEMRQKALHDEASMLAGAKNEGKIEGRLEERQEIARTMLLKGINTQLISELTKLPEEEINKLKTIINNPKQDNKK